MAVTVGTDIWLRNVAVAFGVVIWWQWRMALTVPAIRYVVGAYGSGIRRWHVVAMVALRSTVQQDKTRTKRRRKKRKRRRRRRTRWTRTRRRRRRRRRRSLRSGC